MSVVDLDPGAVIESDLPTCIETVVQVAISVRRLVRSERGGQRAASILGLPISRSLRIRVSASRSIRVCIVHGRLRAQSKRGGAASLELMAVLALRSSCSSLRVRWRAIETR